MKKSVNGLTFEEIFAQRGKKVKSKRLKRGMCYLFEDDEFSSIIMVNGHHGEKEVETNAQIFLGSGNFYTDGFEDYEMAYKATPDQIALLNAYKDEQK